MYSVFGRHFLPLQFWDSQTPPPVQLSAFLAAKIAGDLLAQRCVRNYIAITAWNMYIYLSCRSSSGELTNENAYAL